MKHDETEIDLSGKESQRRFVELLRELTESGKVEWAQSSDEPGIIYCWTGEDLIVFEVRGSGHKERVVPSESAEGAVSSCRNASYLWLPGTPEWETILGLLSRAPVDVPKFISLRRKASEAPVRALLSVKERP